MLRSKVTNASFEAIGGTKMKQRKEIKPFEQGSPRLAIPVLDRFRGALLGLAVGDAVGTTLEFKSPGSFKPIDDMVGGGPFDLAPGEWTDDTSMALCLATSLVEKREFDPCDQMERYVRWWKEGYMSANGRCFDIGNTVRSALVRFLSTSDPNAGLNRSEHRRQRLHHAARSCAAVLLSRSAPSD